MLMFSQVERSQRTSLTEGESEAECRKSITSATCPCWPSRGNEGQLLGHLWRGGVKPPRLDTTWRGVNGTECICQLVSITCLSKFWPMLSGCVNKLLKTAFGEARSHAPSLVFGVLSETGSGGRDPVFCGCGQCVPGTEAEVTPALEEVVLEPQSWCWEMKKVRQWWPGISIQQAAKTRGTGGAEQIWRGKRTESGTNGMNSLVSTDMSDTSQLFISL